MADEVKKTGVVIDESVVSTLDELKTKVVTKAPKSKPSKRDRKSNVKDKNGIALKLLVKHPDADGNYRVRTVDGKPYRMYKVHTSEYPFSYVIQFLSESKLEEVQYPINNRKS